MSSKIVKVVVRGFKSHLNSEFNYAPGLTVVTGPSDSGKSAGVMQPIKWVAFGEPSGEAFLFTIRDPKTKEVVRQAEAAEVELHTDDGLVVLKTRRKGKTAYYIDGKLVSEKAEVPQEVKDVLGLSKQAYGDFETSLNFAYQLEAPFILSETASVGAKVLGKLAGTEIVDKAIAAIMKRTYKARDEKNTAQKIIDQVNVELLEYLQVDDLKTGVEACEALLEQLEVDSARKDRIDQAAARYSVLSDKVDECNQKLERLAVVHELVDDLAVIELAQAKYDEIIQLYGRLKQLEATLESVEKRLTDFLVIGQANTLLNQLEASYAKYGLISGYYNDLTYITGKVSTLEGTLEGFTALPEASNRLAVTEDAYGRLGRVQGYYDSFKGISSRIVENEAIVDKCKAVEGCADLLGEIELKETRAGLIKAQVSYLGTIDVRIAQRNNDVADLGHIPEASQLLDKLIADFERLTKLKQLKADYDTKHTTAINADRKHDQTCISLKEAEAELKAAWEEAGDVCPLCDTPRTADHTHV